MMSKSSVIDAPAQKASRVRRPRTAADCPEPSRAALMQGDGRQLAPVLLVVGAVVWNLIHLRAALTGVAYLDDSSMHEQMVRFATAQIAAGHLPLTSWFSYLGLGSPHFLHYQSLPAIVTGFFGMVIGPNAAFRWSMYLLLSAWPISVYASARLFGASRAAAGAAGAMAPFLVSVPSVGYEQGAYVWIGYGVWTQLWASLTLPLAWGLSWRALRTGTRFTPAALAVALTIALHFETGYLALMPLLLWPAVAPGRFAMRVWRAAVLLGGALLLSAWVLVPLVQDKAWAATNELLHHGALVNGYGAGTVLRWLLEGRLLDYGRLPVVSLFAAIGLGVAGWQARRHRDARALLVLLVACTLLSFGRTTWGPLVNLIPGAQDLFFRRFMMGVQLACLLLAGAGAAAAGGWLRRLAGLVRSRLKARAIVISGRVGALIAVAALVIALIPAWRQLSSYDARNAVAVRAQQAAESVQGRQIGRLIADMAQLGAGRVYAGAPTNWGPRLRVGAVPVFKYLESRDVDEVGYTLRTASLMTDPEVFFDEVNPSDYSLFAVRYLILPRSWLPPIRARLLMRSGPYALWDTDVRGYLTTGTIVGQMAANRTNIGLRSRTLLRSRAAADHRYLSVAFNGAPVTGRHTAVPGPGVDGTVGGEVDDLREGHVAATVNMPRAGIVVLSVSFDPGWAVAVDGRRTATLTIAPALVGVRVPRGAHRLVFTYHGYNDYPMLFTIAGAMVLIMLIIDTRRRRCDRRAAAPGAPSVLC